jgi:hypothetical protein
MNLLKIDKTILIVVVSLLSSIFFIQVYFKLLFQVNVADDFALDSKTKTIFEKYNNKKINSINFDISELDTIKSKNKNILISFGNSQSHSINDYKEDKDHLFSYYLNKVDKESIIVFNLSAPNSNLQEMFVSIVNNSKKLGKQFDTAIISLVFDDTREDGIRESMKNMIDENKIVLKHYYTGINALEALEKQKEKKVTNTLLLKDKMESNINTYLNNVFESYANRGNIRSFFYGELYYFRNWLLGIKPTTKRKKIQRIYEKNIQALKDIVSFSKQNDIQLILYIAPIRQDIEIPYLSSQYLQFKEDVRKIHKVYDLDNVVPAQYWGITNGDWVDFMHFKGKGHKILADELQKILLKEKVVN